MHYSEFVLFSKCHCIRYEAWGNIYSHTLFKNKNIFSNNYLLTFRAVVLHCPYHGHCLLLFENQQLRPIPCPMGFYNFLLKRKKNVSLKLSSQYCQSHIDTDYSQVIFIDVSHFQSKFYTILMPFCFSSKLCSVFFLEILLLFLFTSKLNLTTTRYWK